MAILAAVLFVAFLAAKSCASRDTEVTQEEAITIARRAIDFEPDRVGVRFIPRGIQSNPFWAVSLSLRDAEGNLDRVTVVVVNARTGQVAEVRRES